MALKYNAAKLRLLTAQSNAGNRKYNPPYKQNGTDVRPSDIDKIVEAIYEDLSSLSAGGGGDGNGIFTAANDGGTVSTSFNIGITDTVKYGTSLFTMDETNGRTGIGTSDPFNADPIYGGDAAYAPIFTVTTVDDRYGFNHNNGTVSLSSYMGGGEAYFGTTSSSILHIMANDTSVMTVNPDGTINAVSGDFTTSSGDFRASGTDGFVVQDRSQIGDNYRLKVDNGVLGIELI